MTEVRIKVQPVKVEYLCEKCNENYMQGEGKILLTYPAGYPHKCKCGETKVLSQPYPYIKWVQECQTPKESV